jgi:hypothetical protein
LNVSERTVYWDIAELASQAVRGEGEVLSPEAQLFLPPSCIIRNKSMA